MNTCQRFAGCKNRIHHKQVNTAPWKLTQSRQLVKRFIVMAYEHQSLCCSIGSSWPYFYAGMGGCLQHSPMYGPMVDRESTETMIPPWNCTSPGAMKLQSIFRHPNSDTGNRGYYQQEERQAEGGRLYRHSGIKCR